MDDYDISDCPCPACGHEITHDRRCQHCEDGFNDLYEDDPVNYAPGEEFEDCFECSATGIERWCPKCGKDYWRSLAATRKAPNA